MHTRTAEPERGWRMARPTAPASCSFSLSEEHATCSTSRSVTMSRACGEMGESLTKQSGVRDKVSSGLPARPSAKTSSVCVVSSSSRFFHACLRVAMTWHSVSMSRSKNSLPCSMAFLAKSAGQVEDDVGRRLARRRRAGREGGADRAPGRGEAAAEHQLSRGG